MQRSVGRRRRFVDETRCALLGSWFPRLNHCHRDLLTPQRPPCLSLEQRCCGFESFLQQRTISSNKTRRVASTHVLTKAEPFRQQKLPSGLHPPSLGGP